MQSIWTTDFEHVMDRIKMIQQDRQRIVIMQVLYSSDKNDFRSGPPKPNGYIFITEPDDGNK